MEVVNLKRLLLIVDQLSLKRLKSEGPYDYVFNLSALNMSEVKKTLTH